MYRYEHRLYAIELSFVYLLRSMQIIENVGMLIYFSIDDRLMILK